MPQLTRRLIIHGRVQGVGFRWSLYAQATALGLSGGVRNRRDGSVEALLGGPPEAIESLTEWAGHGPPGARVERLLCCDEPGLDDGKMPAGFELRPTF